MLSRIHGVQFEEQQHPVGGCIENATSLVTGYWCLTSLNIAEMISDMRHHIRLGYIYTRSSVIGGHTLPQGLAGGNLAGGACTADRGAALATLKPRPIRNQ